MLCAICYRLYNFKNVKNTFGEVSLLVKLQASTHNFTKVSLLHGCFSCFFHEQKLYSIVDRFGLNTKEYFLENSRRFLDHCKTLLNPADSSQFFICVYRPSKVTRNFEFCGPCHLSLYGN